MAKKKWPSGPVSKAQWRFFYSNPRLRARWAHELTRRARPHPLKYRSLPRRKGAPGARILRGGLRRS